MAQAICEVVEQGTSLVVEAGTGVGKTFAYLVPVLLSGRRALISTATQALQDQLSVRDIPAVAAALGVRVRATVLKGRASYVCLHRLHQARWNGAAGHLSDPAHHAALAQIQAWAEGSRVGDLAELPGLDERSPIRPWISSTRDNCLGSACPRVGDCHVNRARAEALSADLVVVNHHLFFADQLVRESGVAELLPRAEVVVFDEAHQLPDIGVEFLALAVGSGRLRDLARDLATQGPHWARGLRPWSHLALGLEQAIRQISQLTGRAKAPAARRAWQDGSPEGLPPASWRVCQAAVSAALLAVVEALAATAEAAQALARLHDRTRQLLQDWQRLCGDAAATEAGVRWMEFGADSGARASAGPAWRLLLAPPDCASLFRALLGEAQAAGHGWIFTSATLGHDAGLSWFTERMGLDAQPGLRTLQVESPFDHAQQAALYVPHDLPEPGGPAHTWAVAQAVARWASRLGGRTLVLTTTLRAAAQMAEQLARLVQEGGCAPLDVLAQGALSKRELLARFRAAGKGAARPAVLVACASFWEGVDLAGDVLQLLVIDKLPFPPPDDPLIAARARALGAAGRSVFNACYLPQAAMALKQGAGRLIRSERDTGVLIITDRRLLTRSYGNRLLQALPPMRRLVDETELELALDALVLTRASTTDRPGA